MEDVYDEEEVVLRGLLLAPQERPDETLESIWKWLQELPQDVARFFHFPHASHEATMDFCAKLHLITAPRGTLLCRQGELNTHFYVIVSGSAEVLHHPVGQTKAIRARMGTGGQSGAIVVSSADRARLGCRVGVLSHGMCFGELSASGEARDSSVVALGLSDPDTMTREPTQLLQVDVDAYRKCAPHVLSRAEHALRERVEALAPSVLFSDWPTQELGFFARWMHESDYKQGEVIYSEGDAVHDVYFVLQGSVGLACEHPSVRGGQLNLHHVLPSTFFGEDEVMQGIEERVQTAVAAEDDTVLAAVPARVFQMLLQSEMPSKAYACATTLQKLRASRTNWYDIRMDLGDSAKVPFAFLDHSQSKVLAKEWDDKPLTGERSLDRLFTAATSTTAPNTARRGSASRTRTASPAFGAVGAAQIDGRSASPIGGAGAGGGAGAASYSGGRQRSSSGSKQSSGRRASVTGAVAVDSPRITAVAAAKAATASGSPTRRRHSVHTPQTPEGLPTSGSRPRTKLAFQKETHEDVHSDAELSNFDKFYNSNYQAPSTPVPGADHTPPQARHFKKHSELVEVATPRFELESERPGSAADWNAPVMSSAEKAQAKTKGTVGRELAAIMRAVKQFKKLLQRRRARQAVEKHEAALAAANAAAAEAAALANGHDSDGSASPISGHLTPRVVQHARSGSIRSIGSSTRSIGGSSRSIGSRAPGHRARAGTSGSWRSRHGSTNNVTDTGPTVVTRARHAASVDSVNSRSSGGGSAPFGFSGSRKLSPSQRKARGKPAPRRLQPLTAEEEAAADAALAASGSQSVPPARMRSLQAASTAPAGSSLPSIHRQPSRKASFRRRDGSLRKQVLRVNAHRLSSSPASDSAGSPARVVSSGSSPTGGFAPGSGAPLRVTTRSGLTLNVGGARQDTSPSGGGGAGGAGGNGRPVSPAVRRAAGAGRQRRLSMSSSGSVISDAASVTSDLSPSHASGTESINRPMSPATRRASAAARGRRKSISSPPVRP